jgi:ATP-dependent DNA helicase RecQ
MLPREAASKTAMNPTPSPLDEARSVLKQHFGYDRFKPAQEQVISAALNGEDVLAVLQTGYGKSVCFQIPAAMRDGCALVISPLIALMKDQVDGANSKGIKASFVNSSLDADEVARRLSEFAAGAFKLLYVAPERIGTNLFRAALAKATVSFIVVDEAHCASMWGHDFRPSFARIHEISSMLWQAHNTRPPIIAVTATATNDIEGDIAAAVGMSEGYVRVVGDPVRPNLDYDTMNAQYSEWSSVMRLARQRFSLPGRHLVYASTRKGAEKVVEMLTQDFGDGFALAYHGGMDKDDRTTVQDAFVRGKVSVVVATNAFGMGIDVPDIRTVAHLGVPGSIESYVQETGRAGRDGKPSTVVLIPSEFAITLQRSFIDGNNPPMRVYVRLWDWLCKRTLDGTVIRLSAASIAERLQRETDLGEVSEAAVSTALNVLEGHRLVQRAYYEGGAPVRVNLDEASQAKLRSNKVGKWLLAKALEVAGKSGLDRVEIDVDNTDAPFEMGISARSFSTLLNELDVSDVIDVGRVFTGKTTAVLDPEVDLMERLPVAQLEAKRKRDLARFQAMLTYSGLASNAARRQFIRDYFLGEQPGVSRAVPQG